MTRSEIMKQFITRIGLSIIYFVITSRELNSKLFQNHFSIQYLNQIDADFSTKPEIEIFSMKLTFTKEEMFREMSVRDVCSLSQVPTFQHCNSFA